MLNKWKTKAVDFLLHLWFTQTDSEVAVAPDPEVKQQVLIELWQQAVVALIGHLLEQELCGHQYAHVHHTAGDLRRETVE